MRKYLFGGIAVLVLGIAIISVAVNRHRAPVPAASGPKQAYVALGDSVAAGVGLPTYSDSSACDRTNESYPNQVAQMGGYSLKSIACGGASLPVGILGSQDVNKLAVPPQLDQLFALPKPNLVSLTVGANDLQWTELLTSCYTGQCGTEAETAVVDERVAEVSANLHTMLANVQNHYKIGSPKLVVTGYYQALPLSDISCSDLTGVDQDERVWVHEQQTKLNEAIRSTAADFSFTVYVPVDFSGHELCTADSWVQGLADKNPYHPTEAGQAAIAKQVLAAAKGKT